MFPQLETSMLLKDLQIELLCPAHDRHRKALQVWHCSFLQQQQYTVWVLVQQPVPIAAVVVQSFHAAVSALATVQIQIKYQLQKICLPVASPA
jgi:hypothetical protein